MCSFILDTVLCSTHVTTVINLLDFDFYVNFKFCILGPISRLPMSSGNSYYDDLRTKPEVIDLSVNEDTLDVGEHVNDTAESALKPNVAISSNVRELLECPVCLNAMYPPISQVQFLIVSIFFVYPIFQHSYVYNSIIHWLEFPIFYVGIEDLHVYYSYFCFLFRFCWFFVVNNPFPLFMLVQCSNGHTLCSGCKPRVHNRCPTCRHELGNIRCLALEKVAASLELPCKYQNFGCIGIYPYYSKLKHESQCSFRPYNCPYAGSECSVIGDIPFLVSHLKDDHKVDMHSGSTFNHRYVKSNPHEVENATWMLTVT